MISPLICLGKVGINAMGAGPFYDLRTVYKKEPHRHGVGMMTLLAFGRISVAVGG